MASLRRLGNLSHLGGYAALLFSVGLDHLSGHASREGAMLATFEQNSDHNSGTPAWRESHKPAIIFELAAGKLFARVVAYNLSASGLPGEVHALQMRLACCANRAHNAGHRVGNDLPILRVNVHALLGSVLSFLIL